MDDNLLGIDRELTSANLSPIDLEIMGRRASDMYLSKTSSLGDAVVKLARQRPNITSEQVKRVVEHANVDTFQTLFEKSAGDKNIDFDLADPGKVLDTLDLEARPVEKTSMPSEYASDPVKLGHSDLEGDLALCEIFGMSPKTEAMEKTAEGGPLTKEAMAHVSAGKDDTGLFEKDLQKSVSMEAIQKFSSDRGSYPESNPHGELIRTQQRLTKLADDANRAVQSNAMLTKDATTRFSGLVERSLWDGGNLGEIVHAVGKVSPPEFVKLALSEIVPTLVERGLDVTRAQVEAINYEMEKGASSRTVNKDNEIVQAFADLTKSAFSHLELVEAKKMIDEALSEANGVLKEAMRREHVTSTE